MVPMADCFCLDAHVACKAGLEASRNGDLINQLTNFLIIIHVSKEV
jgi:hypothetical protein